MTFGTSGITLDVISITPASPEVDEDIALPTLGLDAGDNIPYEPGDLVEGGEYVVELADDHDTDIALRTVETITYTKPLQSGDSAAASRAFDGYIKKVEESNAAISERATITVTVKVAGDVTWTAATAS
jgi:hypothetical protein